MDVWIISLILLITLYLLITEKISVDLTAIGVDPKPFIIGVCIGASACFATPIGYQTNLMVYGSAAIISGTICASVSR